MKSVHLQLITHFNLKQLAYAKLIDCIRYQSSQSDSERKMYGIFFDRITRKRQMIHTLLTINLEKK